MPSTARRRSQLSSRLKLNAINLLWEDLPNVSHTARSRVSVTARGLFACVKLRQFINVCGFDQEPKRMFMHLRKKLTNLLSNQLGRAHMFNICLPCRKWNMKKFKLIRTKCYTPDFRKQFFWMINVNLGCNKCSIVEQTHLLTLLLAFSFVQEDACLKWKG